MMKVITSPQTEPNDANNHHTNNNPYDDDKAKKKQNVDHNKIEEQKHDLVAASLNAAHLIGANLAKANE